MRALLLATLSASTATLALVTVLGKIVYDITSALLALVTARWPTGARARGSQRSSTSARRW